MRHCENLSGVSGKCGSDDCVLLTLCPQHFPHRLGFIIQHEILRYSAVVFARSKLESCIFFFFLKQFFARILVNLYGHILRFFVCFWVPVSIKIARNIRMLLESVSANSSRFEERSRIIPDYTHYTYAPKIQLSIATPCKLYIFILNKRNLVIHIILDFWWSALKKIFFPFN